MSNLARLRFEELRGVPLARISGEIDASNASELGDEMVRSVSNQAPGLVLDLTATEYFDSSGVHLLFDMARRLRQRQQELRVVVRGDSFAADLLRLTGFDSGVPLDRSVADAAEALASRQVHPDEPSA